MTTTRTGGSGGDWVELDRPKPPSVADRYEYWSSPPPERSARCAYWLAQVGRGWRPSRRVRGWGYDGAASWYGVWIWEYLHEIRPALAAVERVED